MKLVLCALACLLLIPPLRGQKVSVDYDKAADFSHIRSYQWRTHPIFEKDPALAEQYAVGIQLVLGAGNRELMKKGLHPSDDPSDVLVTFFITAENNREMRTIITDAAPGAWYGWYGQPMWTETRTEVDYFLSGMLVLDIVDAATSKLIWRAVSTDTIRDMSKRAKNIDSAMRKALDHFPPKQK